LPGGGGGGAREAGGAGEGAGEGAGAGAGAGGRGSASAHAGRVYVECVDSVPLYGREKGEDRQVLTLLALLV
jgi:hypothetical protein